MGNHRAATERFAGAMENLVLLADTMQQASALLADEEGDAPKSSTSFLSAVALGNVVSSCLDPFFLHIFQSSL